MPTADAMSPLQSRPERKPHVWTRFAYGVVAVVTAGIGLVGVWLPGLPTTPFVLVALWAAARSSDRLSAWLHRVRVLRAAVVVAEDYAQTRSLPMRLKVLSQVMAYSAIPIVYLVTGTAWISGVVACAAAASTVFMVATPTRRVAPRPVEALSGSDLVSNAAGAVESKPYRRP